MRKLETRTKIQLGGLIIKSGLADLLEIRPGDDLQLDANHHDKAKILLGILVDAKESLINDRSGFTYFMSKAKKVTFL